MVAGAWRGGGERRAACRGAQLNSVPASLWVVSLCRTVLAAGSLREDAGSGCRLSPHALQWLISRPLDSTSKIVWSSAAGSGGGAPGVPPRVGSVIRGALCWALLGAIIGFAETTLKGTQHWKGAMGGVIGGLFGGLTHEALRTRADGDSGQLILAASLAVLGGAICLAIATISTLLSGAWFEVVDGKMADRQIDLTKFVRPRSGGQPEGLIGRDEWRCQIFLPGDAGIQPCHATIRLVDGAPTISSTNSSSPLQINGDRVTRARLQDGDRLIIGSTSLIYRVKRQNGRLI